MSDLSSARLLSLVLRGCCSRPGLSCLLSQQITGVKGELFTEELYPIVGFRGHCVSPSVMKGRQSISIRG